jgi:hypothetical protein
VKNGFRPGFSAFCWPYCQKLGKLLHGYSFLKGTKRKKNMVMLDALLDQTAFLLDKQKEAKRDCLALFADLLSAIEARLTKTKSDKGNAEEYELLEKIKDMIVKQSELINHDAQEDIDFLADQLKALQEIKNIKDPVKAKNLLGMLLDEDIEIKDSAAFKKEVSEEAALSRQNLVVMLNDLKEAVQDGNAQEVLQYLESVLSEAEGCCEECEDEEDDCCGKKACPKSSASAKSCCGGCCQKDDSESMDIFACLDACKDDEDETDKKGKKKK